MKKKIIIPVIAVILLLVVGLVYMNKSRESSLTPIPTETPAPTATPTPTPEPHLKQTRNMKSPLVFITTVPLEK